MKIEKKYIIIGILLFLFVLAIPPIILNFVTFSWGTKYTNGNLSSWISFFGSYLGSIWGGVIGGVVAVIVAKVTVNEQLKKEIDKDFLIKRWEQLPSLARVKSEFKKISQQIYEVQNSQRIFRHHNPPEYVEEHFESLTYEVEPLNERNVAHLERITDITIQTNLVEIFEFYNKYSKAYNVNLPELLAESNILEGKLRENEGDFVLRNKKESIDDKIMNVRLARHNLEAKCNTIFKEEFDNTYQKVNELFNEIQVEVNNYKDNNEI
jgi:hypothetical protein